MSLFSSHLIYSVMPLSIMPCSLQVCIEVRSSALQVRRIEEYCIRYMLYKFAEIEAIALQVHRDRSNCFTSSHHKKLCFYKFASCKTRLDYTSSFRLTGNNRLAHTSNESSGSLVRDARTSKEQHGINFFLLDVQPSSSWITTQSRT